MSKTKKRSQSSVLPKEMGDCYDENGRRFLDMAERPKNPNVTYKLVHGAVTNSRDKKPMGHCWIEATHKLGEIEQIVCLDFSNGHAHSLSMETYYYCGEVKDTVKYELDEYRQLLLSEGHWGRFESLGLPENR